MNCLPSKPTRSGWRTHPHSRAVDTAGSADAQDMRWGAVVAEEAAEEQRQRDESDDGDAPLGTREQRDEPQDSHKEQQQTALQQVHRTGLGFGHPFVEEQVSQGQGRKEAHEQGRQD